jgi:amino acid transporter
VAISWSSYFKNILANVFGVNLPDYLTIGYQTAKHAYEAALAEGQPVQDMIYATAPKIAGIPFIINLPAFIIVVLVTMLAYIGIKESKNTANFMVGLKIAVLLLIAAIGIWIIFTDDLTGNWTPFLPNGMSGVLKGVSAVFFAYIGFDAISTTAEECRNPQRDMPRGMIYSLIICTVIYVITTLVITGLVKYENFKGVTDPLAFVFDSINMQKLGTFISISAVVAATSVMLVFQIGQPRIWMSMSRDGLMPKSFGKIHKKYQTPWFATIITGLVVGIPVLFVDDLLMTDLTSIGTLFAFVLVCGGVLILPRMANKPGRFNLPYINAKFIIPVVVLLFTVLFWERIQLAVSNIDNEGYQEVLFLVFMVVAWLIAVFSFIRNYSLIPVLGMLCCLYLMIEIPAKSWLVFFGWMAAGLLIYFIYGYRKSKLAGS